MRCISSYFINCQIFNECARTTNYSTYFHHIRCFYNEYIKFGIGVDRPHNEMICGYNDIFLLPSLVQPNIIMNNVRIDNKHSTTTQIITTGKNRWEKTVYMQIKWNFSIHSSNTPIAKIKIKNIISSKFAVALSFSWILSLCVSCVIKHLQPCQNHRKLFACNRKSSFVATQYICHRFIIFFE